MPTRSEGPLVVNHIELYADALEVAVQGLVHLLHLLGIAVSGVWVELLKHTTDSILHKFLLIDGVHVEIGRGYLGYL